MGQNSEEVRKGVMSRGSITGQCFQVRVTKSGQDSFQTGQREQLGYSSRPLALHPTLTW